MKIFQLKRSQILPIDIEAAWMFFSNPANLAIITPAHLGLRIKGDIDAKTISGMLIEYTVTPLFGIQMDWVSEIKHVQAPYYFVDEQRVGPYKFWYHEHRFNIVEQNKVEVIDIVHYALPLGVFAPLLNSCIVSKKLKEIFDFRCEVLNKKFANQSAA